LLKEQFRKDLFSNNSNDVIEKVYTWPQVLLAQDRNLIFLQEGGRAQEHGPIIQAMPGCPVTLQHGRKISKSPWRLFDIIWKIYTRCAAFSFCAVHVMCRRVCHDAMTDGLL